MVGTKTDDPPCLTPQEQHQKTTTTISDFLEKHSLPVLYAPWLLRIVDNLPQLLNAYRDKREFMNDIRESLPSMKGGHRLLLWKAMCKTRRGHASTSTADLDETQEYGR